MLTGQYIDSVCLTGEVEQLSYLHALPVVRYLKENALELHQPVTFLVGENGTGKSTLLEAIAVAFGFNAEGGTKNFTFSTKATHSSLWESLTLIKSKFAKDGFFLRAEGFYNVATSIDEMDEIAAFAPKLIDSYGGISMHNQSHGESFLALVQNRFGGDGLYILDEPEAALSPMRQMSLLVEINRLVKRRSQFLIATHSPILMAYPEAEIYCLNEAGVQRTRYEDTEHYQVSRQFLEHHEQLLHYLLEDES